MSALASVIELPVRPELEERDSLEHDIVLDLATADDLASGMDAVVRRVRRDSAAAKAEWWAEDDDGALELVAVDGIARGGRDSVQLGRAGVFVLHGGHLDSRIDSALSSLAPIIRRRAAEERLAPESKDVALEIRFPGGVHPPVAQGPVDAAGREAGLVEGEPAGRGIERHVGSVHIWHLVTRRPHDTTGCSSRALSAPPRNVCQDS